MNEVGVKGDRGGLVAGVEWQRGVLSCAEVWGKWRFIQIQNCADIPKFYKRPFFDLEY